MAGSALHRRHIRGSGRGSCRLKATFQKAQTCRAKVRPRPRRR